MPNLVKQYDNLKPEQIPDEVFNSTRPLLLKGLCEGWPAVRAGVDSAETFSEYLLRFDEGHPLIAYEGPPEIKGRIFYNENFSGFNFLRTRQTLSQVVSSVLKAKTLSRPPSYYVGSTMVERWLPGFSDQNSLEMGGRENLMSLWFGNQSKIAAHYDFPSNIAICIAGHRKITLFAPEQGKNLYVGPLEFTPSGQPISLVDSCNPDLDQFPKYEKAMSDSFIVELEPGDAVMIPSMWGHHVESTAPVNALVNYWWRSTPAYLGSPLNTLQHAVMSLKTLPKEQREVWRSIFDQYVFSDDQEFIDHIPDHARGILGGVDEQSAKLIKAQLIKFLKP